MEFLTPPVPLGPFDLVRQIGRGGMGRVYRALHREQGVHVAVKVLDSARTDDPAFRRAFESEVQSVAGLDHPGIVLVFDHGRVPEAAAAASDGELVEGSPYLVMELAAGGSLADLARTLDWGTLRAVLRVLLDALAHAHARGVVHRDIKRSNVLVGLPGDVRPGLKLSDFGLAHRISELSGVRSFEREAVGTPNYMSPEQVQARFRDYGPWTDLYAVGCLAWSLATGHPVYTGSAVEVMAAHCRSEVPAFEPVLKMPAGLDDWLDRLLQKETWRRYECAADALAALECFGGGDGGEVCLPMRRGRDAPIEAPVSTLTWTLPVAPPRPVTSAPPRMPPNYAVPSFPESWRAKRAIPSFPRMLGVGLGLFGMRRLRLVGRHPLQDRLWEELGHVHRSGRSRAFLVSADPGGGKSRGARWLTERASELGLARIVRIVCGPAAGRQQGLAAAVDRELGLKGLDRAACRDRISELLRRYSAWDARWVVDLVEVVRPANPDGRTLSEERRHEAVAELFDLLASRRPVVIWIEDLERDADVGRLCQKILLRQEAWPAPLLLLATHRSGEPSAAGGEVVREILDSPQASQLQLGPLPRDAERKLVEELLGIAPRLADQVLHRAAGNPMFAVQLVGSWVQRGDLVASPQGFVLRSGAPDDLPDDIHGLWRARIEAITEHEGEDSERALEVAAALGREVDERDWLHACERAGVSDPHQLLTALFEHGLARRHRDGWAFVHGMLRESVERRSRDRGRWQGASRACAEALDKLPGLDPLRRAHRLGRLWEAAGDPPRAALARADGLAATGRVTEAGETAAAVVELARAAGRGGLEGAARIHIGVAAMRERRYEGALVVLEQARSLLEAAADEHGTTEAERLLSRCLASSNRVEEAIELGRSALHRAERLGDPAVRAQVLITLGAVLRRIGRVEEAEKLVLGAAAILDRKGHRLRLAEAWLLAADIRRRRRDLDGAEELLLRCRQLWRDAGSLYAGTVDLNLALLDIERERFEAASVRLAEAIRVADEEGDEYVSCAGRVLGLSASAGLSRWPDVLGLLDQLGQVDRLIADPDTAHAAETAGDLAARADERELAVRCWDLARSLWREVGDRGRLLKTEVKLDELVTSAASLVPVSGPSD